MGVLHSFCIQNNFYEKMVSGLIFMSQHFEDIIMQFRIGLLITGLAKENIARAL